MLTSIRSLLRRRHSQTLPSISLLSQTQPSRVPPPFSRLFSTSGSGKNDDDNNKDPWANAWNGGDQPQVPTSGLDWGDSWSTGYTKDHFDGEAEAVGRPAAQDPQPQPQPPKTAREIAVTMDEEDELVKMLEDDNKESKKFVDGWDGRMMETYKLMKQVREPGARGEYLKDSEKAEMYRLYKENPAVNTVEKLAKDFRVMRQRVHAILWLKEMEEEEEKKLGKPLDDSVEILLDNFPEFFNSHDREFHVASLRYKPDFKVMPEGWDGTIRDPDEVLYEISMKEDQRLYEEFVQRLNFNKKKVAGEVKCHKYSRRRPAEGWNFTVEKMGQRDKRGGGGGWKFVSLPDGSSRALNDMEKMYVNRETPKPRKRILPPFKLKAG